MLSEVFPRHGMQVDKFQVDSYRAKKNISLPQTDAEWFFFFYVYASPASPNLLKRC